MAGAVEGHGWAALKEKYRLEHEAVRANWIHNGYELTEPEYVEKDNEFIRTGEWRSAVIEEAA